MDSFECPICTEKFDTILHKKITCVHCNVVSCSKCTKKYLLSQIEDPACMSCKKGWSREILVSYFGKVFVNTDLKNHREDVLFDRQKALLPSTQAEAFESAARKRSQTLEKEARKKMTEEIARHQQQIRNLKDDFYRLQAYYRNGVISAPAEKRNTVIGKCTECRGYINSNNKCSLCETKFCPDCLEKSNTNIQEVVEDGKVHKKHVCNENAKSTIELLRKDSKACPGCGTFIYKIEGCYQMWCTSCHTTFCWRTGSILRENVHNPHYFEYLRTHPELREAVNECRDANYMVYNRLQNSRTMSTVSRQYCQEMYRNLEELNRRVPTNIADELKKCRIKYLNGEINEKEFKKESQIAEKKISRAREIQEVYATTLQLVQATLMISPVETLKENVKTIVSEANDIIKNVNSTYMSTAKCTIQLRDAYKHLEA